MKKREGLERVTFIGASGERLCGAAWPIEGDDEDEFDLLDAHMCCEPEGHDAYKHKCTCGARITGAVL